MLGPRCSPDPGVLLYVDFNYLSQFFVSCSDIQVAHWILTNPCFLYVLLVLASF